MASILASNSYGKSAVRVLKVERHGKRHVIRELAVDIALEGEFTAAHTAGDNSAVLPTDTMKNTVYAKAREIAIGEPEDFALALATHFLGASAATATARVSIAESGWRRLAVGDAPHDHAFERASNELRVARVSLARGATAEVMAGIDNLLILKSTGSGFSGYPRDAYTTLRETDDRILATSITARWRYRAGAAYGEGFDAVRGAMLQTFAGHDSKSVQHTLHAMGEAALAACADVEEISITMPNKHYLLADLSPFGLDNKNEVFVPTSEPYGLIEATLKRQM
jgi:urate oxidase